MGLTIHYSLNAQGDDAHARTLVNALRQAALDLPFNEIGQVVELRDEQCDFSNRTQNDPLRWLLVQACESVEGRRIGGRNGYRTWYKVLPTRLIAFDTWPGEGCEAANFGLCQYPAEIEAEDGPLKTRLPAWHWSSFCKTQYASDPRRGGAANFLRCHLSVIAMLDHAKELGCLARVSDEGGFWEKRSLPALVQEVGSWNEMIAAFGGKLKDLLVDGPLTLESAIAHDPDVERLEAAGQNQLPPALHKLVGLIERVKATIGQAAEVQCEPIAPGASS